MKTTRLLTALVAFATITILAADASAFYNPSIGRFLQRDPGAGAARHAGGAGPAVEGRFIPRDQYTDGMNLYQYVRSSSPNLLDPLGLAAVFTYKAALTTGAEEVSTTYTGDNLNVIQIWLVPEAGSVSLSFSYKTQMARKVTRLTSADTKKCCDDNEPPDLHEVTAVSIDVAYLQTLAMPAWSHYGKGTKDDKADWDAWIKRLRAHEQGHMDINRFFVSELVNGATENHDIQFESCDRNEKNNIALLTKRMHEAVVNDLNFMKAHLDKWQREYHMKVGNKIPFYENK